MRRRMTTVMIKKLMMRMVTITMKKLTLIVRMTKIMIIKAQTTNDEDYDDDDKN